MCDQSREVTKSPNHWCASSCATRGSLLTSPAAAASCSVRSVRVVAEVFSMPPMVKSETTTWAYLGQAYGTPMV